MYSRGMGSALRCVAIASHLSRSFPRASFLALTDLPILGRFPLPPNFDYVHFPAAESGDGAAEFTPHLESGSEAGRLRRTIVATTVECLEPDLVVVDRHPLGIDRELQATLVSLRERRPGARLVAGLPDVLGEPAAVRAAWESTGVIDSLAQLYDEIWVYGAPDVYGEAPAEGLPTSVRDKIVYTGYLRYDVDPDEARAKAQREGIATDEPLVLVSAGSGRGGYPLLDTYLDFCEKLAADHRFESHLVCGPHMPAGDRKALEQRSRKLSAVQVNTFHANFMPYVQAASVVVATFGYNTCCELLSLDKPAVVLPCQRSASEQVVRARAMAQRGLVGLLEPDELSPERLGVMVLERMNASALPRRRTLPLDGLETVARRVLALVSSTP
jgi:predicted glycosyltransferase